MPGLFPNPSAASEAFQPGDQVRWYVGDAHISPYVGVVVHLHPGIQKVDVDFPVGGVTRLSPEDLILVTRFVGETTSAPDGGDYSGYDKTRSDKAYGTFDQNLRDMAKSVASKKASSEGKSSAQAVAERFAADVVEDLAADVAECVSSGIKDVEAYQKLYPKYASKCSDAFLRGSVKRVYAVAQGRPGAFDYKKVDTSTLEGLKEAERLKEQGWKIVQTGLHILTFERLKKGKEASDVVVRDETEDFMREMASKAGIKPTHVGVNIHVGKAYIGVDGASKEAIDKFIKVCKDAGVEAKEEHIHVWNDNSKQINHVIGVGIDDIMNSRPKQSSSKDSAVKECLICGKPVNDKDPEIRLCDECGDARRRDAEKGTRQIDERVP